MSSLMRGHSVLERASSRSWASPAGDLEPGGQGVGGSPVPARHRGQHLAAFWWVSMFRPGEDRQQVLPRERGTEIRGSLLSQRLGLREKTDVEHEGIDVECEGPGKGRPGKTESLLVAKLSSLLHPALLNWPLLQAGHFPEPRRVSFRRVSPHSATDNLASGNLKRSRGCISG